MTPQTTKMKRNGYDNYTSICVGNKSTLNLILLYLFTFFQRLVQIDTPGVPATAAIAATTAS